MSQHLGAGSAHIARVHRHRERVATARQAVLAEARATAEAHYAASRSAAPATPRDRTESGTVPTVPPTDQ